MYTMPKSRGTIIAKGKMKEFARELDKHRVITPEFISDCKKTRTNITPEAMAEMNSLFEKSRK